MQTCEIAQIFLTGAVSCSKLADSLINISSGKKQVTFKIVKNRRIFGKIVPYEIFKVFLLQKGKDPGFIHQEKGIVKRSEVEWQNGIHLQLLERRKSLRDNCLPDLPKFLVQVQPSLVINKLVHKIAQIRFR